LDIVLKSIDFNIQKCREIKYPEYDAILNKIVKSFEEMPNVKSLESDGKKTFLFPHSEVVQLFKFLSEYKLTNLIEDSNKMVETDLNKNSKTLASILNNILNEEVCDIEKMKKAFNKRSSRFSILCQGEKVHITTRLNLILCCHNTNADLSMLKDFTKFKEELTIVNKYFVTTGKGLKNDD
jgi:hypothetical protein